MSDQRHCQRCGRARIPQEMDCVTIGGVERYTCNKTYDPDCESSKGRSFEWYDGWRRARGLEPHDSGPGSEATYVFELAEGVEKWYHIDGDLYGVVGEFFDGEIKVCFVERTMLVSRAIGR